MGEQGKELLKQHIKHKRASEGLTEIPDDLFVKRPRYEMTKEELVKRSQRRQKNKEAAEKSRKKKKEEFLNLQTENDQLQQDKCQLVSMIEQLKSTLSNLNKENTGLRCNMDHLKRWIGKHASDLGLAKHVQKKRDGEKHDLTRTTDGASREGVLRGNPSLHSAGAEANEDEDQLPSATSSSLSSSTARFSPSPPLAASPSAFPLVKTPTRVASPASPRAVSESSSPQRPTQEFFQPVGIRTVVTLPQPPAPLVAEMPPEKLNDREPRQQQEVMYDGGQQIVYVSKDSVFIVPGEDGRQFMVVNPGVQRQTQENAPGLQIITATQNAPQVGFEASEVQKNRMETSEAQDASLETPQARVKTPEAQEASVEVPEANAQTPDTQDATVEAMEASVEATHATTKAPEMETSGDIGNTQEALRGDMIEKGAAANETTTSVGETENPVPSGSSMPPPDLLATSIDLLLKAGCTIQLPEGFQLVKTADARPLGENHDHSELSQSHRPS